MCTCEYQLNHYTFWNLIFTYTIAPLHRHEEEVKYLNDRLSCSMQLKCYTRQELNSTKELCRLSRIGDEVTVTVT